MTMINKVDAFIKIAQAASIGDDHRVREMNRIMNRTIKKEINSKQYYNDIELNKKEKKIFSY